MRDYNAKYNYPVTFLQKKDKEFHEAVKNGTATRAVSNAIKEGVFDMQCESEDDVNTGIKSNGDSEDDDGAAE